MHERVTVHAEKNKWIGRIENVFSSCSFTIQCTPVWFARLAGTARFRDGKLRPIMRAICFSIWWNHQPLCSNPIQPTPSQPRIGCRGGVGMPRCIDVIFDSLPRDPFAPWSVLGCITLLLFGWLLAYCLFRWHASSLLERSWKKLAPVRLSKKAETNIVHLHNNSSLFLKQSYRSSPLMPLLWCMVLPIVRSHPAQDRPRLSFSPSFHNVSEERLTRWMRLDFFGQN